MKALGVQVKAIWFVLLFSVISVSVMAQGTDALETVKMETVKVESVKMETIKLVGLNQFRQTPVSVLAGQNCHAQDTDDSQWQAFEFPNVKAQQHLCIRGTLTVTEEPLLRSNNRPSSNHALLFLALAAYNIYLDGELLGKNGVPGATPDLEQVGGISLLLPLDLKTLSPGEHLISMEISSHHASTSFAAVAWALLFVDQQVFYDTVLVATVVTALLAGALLVMFVVFITLYLRFSRQTSYLLFALLCFFTATLLLTEQWKLWVNYPYDLHLHRLYLVIVLTLLVTALLPGYYLAQYGLHKNRLWFVAIALVLWSAVLFTYSYDARSEWLFISALGFVLSINLVALWQKKTGAIPALIITSFSLLALLIAPRVFIELGFGLSIALVLASIGVSLLNQLTQQRKLALESGKVKGELLRRNLQPHYLMNCLMQVQELIDTSPQKASQFVQHLAEEFRTLVKMSDKDVVSLEDELRLCRSHLQIMSARYQQDYQLQVDFESTVPGMTLTEVMVPSAIIHCQIENVFTHSRISSDIPIRLKVNIIKKEIQLQLVTPVGIATDHHGAGIGETYIQAKMSQVCKPGWQLQSAQQGRNWITRYHYCILSEISSPYPVSAV